MRFVVFLLAVFIFCLSAPAWAKKASLEKKIIKTSFFTIELPERFVHVEGSENDRIDHTEGRFFAITKDYFIMGDKALPPDGSAFVIEYSDGEEVNKSNEKQFIEETLKFYIDDIIKEGAQSDDQTIISKPAILEQNKDFIALHMSTRHNYGNDEPNMSIFIYTFLLKRLNTGVHYFYMDSNDIETGRKAAQDIYEQIKKTSLEINPPKSPQLNKFNP